MPSKKKDLDVRSLRKFMRGLNIISIFSLMVVVACSEGRGDGLGYLETKDLPADFEVIATSSYEDGNETYLCYLVMSDRDMNPETPKAPLVVKHKDGESTDGIVLDVDGKCEF